MAVFRVEKTRDFTVMVYRQEWRTPNAAFCNAKSTENNHHLRNKNLSLRAKGLLSLMLSLPEDWDYTMKGLARISTEGVDAIRTVIREPEEHGYHERHRKRKEKGQPKDVEYVIHERPVIKTEDKQEFKQPILDNAIPDEPISEIPALDEPVSEQTTQLNTNILNTKELNTNFIKYPSINNKPEEKKTENTEKERWIDRYNKNKELVKQNIDYEYLCLYHDNGIINNIVNIMAEVLTVDRDTYVIEGEVYPGVIVQERFKEVDYSTIESFLIDFEKRTAKIYNMKSYLITSLFNMPSTSALQLNNTVAYNMCL